MWSFVHLIKFSQHFYYYIIWNKCNQGFYVIPKTVKEHVYFLAISTILWNP